MTTPALCSIGAVAGIAMVPMALRTGTRCWVPAGIIVLPDRTSVLQQEWDCGICAEPHISGIFLQHSRSWTVMAPLDITHAKSGAAVQEMASSANAMMTKRRMT